MPSHSPRNEDGAFVPAPAHEQAFEQALVEYVESQLVNSDQPGSHVNLAVVHEARGRRADAEEAYGAALDLDSTFVAAHLNLAMLYDELRMEAQRAGRQDDATRRQRRLPFPRASVERLPHRAIHPQAPCRCPCCRAAPQLDIEPCKIGKSTDRDR